MTKSPLGVTVIFLRVRDQNAFFAVGASSDVRECRRWGCYFVVRGYLRDALCVLYVAYRVRGSVYEPQIMTKKKTA